MTREPIYAALFAKLEALKTAGAIATCSRRLLHWNDVGDIAQPAVFMTQGNQAASHQSKALPFKWDLDVKIYVYVQASELVAPAQVLNPILDAIEAILAPANGQQQTLGGLCDVCYIDGAIETFEGTLGTQEVAFIPVKISVR
jgi:hypothetical protein